MIKPKLFLWLITIVFLLLSACGPTYVRSLLLTDTKFDFETNGIVKDGYKEEQFTVKRIYIKSFKTLAKIF